MRKSINRLLVLFTVVLMSFTVCLGAAALTDLEIAEDIDPVIGDYVTEGHYRYSLDLGGCAEILSVDSSISGDVVIPDTVNGYKVRGIGAEAFKNCTEIKSVKFPEGITKIEKSAFENCTSLESVIIPDGVSTISDYVFMGCTSLESVTISDGVTYIGGRPFGGCTSLKSVTIPCSVKTIVIPAFDGCASLERITVDENNMYFSSDDHGVLFNKDKTKLIDYPDGNKGTTYEIPDSVTSIGICAFENCTNLESVIISESVTEIGSFAFESCTNLKSIAIPYSVKTIGWNFRDCVALERITVDENNVDFSSDEHGGLFNKDKTTLLMYPSGRTSTSYIVPESVTTIMYSDAFAYCKYLEDVYYLGSKNSSLNTGSATIHYCEKVETDATCTEAGTVKYACKECSDSVVVKTISAPLGHNMGSYVVTTKPTCTASGVERSTCTRCNHFVTRTVAATGHSYTSKVTAPTCTASGYTTYSCSCGDSYKSNTVSALGHSFTNYKKDNNATCTADGTKTAKCDRCTVTKTVTDTGSALGHNMGAYVVTIKPTATTEGVERSDCSRCDYYVTRVVPVEVNIYNIGEETYRFSNFGDSDSAGGHCFGMSVTSSGYYIGSLDKSIIGGNDATDLYSFNLTARVKAPICYYHKIQGPGPEQKSMVAGGSIDLRGTINTLSDWNSCVNYVKSHKYDNEGSLQIGMWYKGGGGHAVNFLYYANVNGQDRIYAYDNNFPTKETYYYMGTDGYIHQYVPGYIVNISIMGMDLMDVYTYYSLANEFKSSCYIYANKDEIIVENATMYDLKCSEESEINVMFEIPEGSTMVKIIPLVDNAEFEYLQDTYSFGGVNEETYGKLSLTKSGDSAFVIVAGDDCTCNCHKTGFAGFIWKILNFIYKLFRINQECICGKIHY